MYQFEFCTIIDIFKLNVHGTDPKKHFMSNLNGSFTEDDVYGLVLVYYDEDEE
jgi:hypothetical protein